HFVFRVWELQRQRDAVGSVGPGGGWHGNKRFGRNSHTAIRTGYRKFLWSGIVVGGANSRRVGCNSAIVWHWTSHTVSGHSGRISQQLANTVSSMGRD